MALSQRVPYLRVAATLSMICLSLHVRADVCVNSAQDFMAKEKELPKVLQNLPLMFTAENQTILFFDVSAAIKIQKDPSGRLRLQGYLRKDDDLEVDESLIKKACFADGTMEITVESGSTYEVDVKGTEVAVKGLTLQRVKDDRSFSATLARMKKGIPGLTASLSSPSSKDRDGFENPQRGVQ